MMNRLRISQEENESLVSSVPKTILLSILMGIGLGIGFYIIKKIGMK